MLGIFEIALQDANFEIVNVVTICIEMQFNFIDITNSKSSEVKRVNRSD